MNSPFHHRVARLLLLLVTLGVAGCDAIEGRLYGRAADQLAEGDRTELLEDGAMHVILCGTGSPLPDPDRAAACTAVIAGGKLFLVDTGPGSWENVQLWRLPRAKLGGVFLTHFHSDHIGELGEVGVQSWIAGRATPLEVYGPVGVKRIADGFRLAYGLDAQYRIAHHGGDNLPPPGALIQGNDIAAPAPGETSVVLEESGLRVLAFAVDHQPVSPAYGYRFEYGGRAVVISGDTDRTEAMVTHAEGADVLVHEALAKDMIEKLSAAIAERGEARWARLTADILDYHTSPAEAVDIAVAAHVPVLVLTHIVPPPTNRVIRRLLLADVETPDGLELVVGDDGTHIRLPIDSDEIEIGLIE